MIRFVQLLVIITILSGHSDTIPIKIMAKKAEIYKVSLSLDGNYAAAIYIGEKDKYFLKTFNVKSKETHTLGAMDDLDIYTYYWASNSHLVYKVCSEALSILGGRRHYKHMGSIDRELKTKKLFQPGWNNYLVDRLQKDSNNVLVWKGYTTKVSKIGYLNIHTGKIRKKRRGFRGDIWWWETDFEHQPRMVGVYKKGSSGYIKGYFRHTIKSDWEKLDVPDVCDIYCFTPDKNKIYVSDYKQENIKNGSNSVLYSTRKNTKGLYSFDLLNNKKDSLIFRDSTYDFIGDLIFFDNPFNKPEDHLLRGISHWTEKIETHWFDDKLTAVQTEVDKKFPNCINEISDADTGLSNFLIETYSDIKPPEYYYFNFGENKFTLLYRSRPWIQPESMSTMKPISFTTRDGLNLHGYLTIPKNGQKPYPTVVLLRGGIRHGVLCGPFSRDIWDFDNEVQILANRGYAVLQVNYRGSTGYGYNITKKHEFSYHLMHLDGIDATKHFIKTGVIDPERVAVIGFGFGGTLAMNSVAEEPQLYKCVVSRSGIYAWKKHIFDKTGVYNNIAFNYYYRNVGAASDNRRDYLESISPLSKVDKIKIPVLLCGGSDDRAVLSQQTKIFRTALAFSGNSPETYVAGAEGHYYFLQKHITIYYERLTDFLKRNLKN
jgi:dienelactone hydrolase